MFKELRKKILAILLVAVMVVATGCGGKDEPVTNVETDEKTEEKPSGGSEDTAPSADMTTITLYRDSFNVTPDTKEVQAVQDAINEYIGDKINVQIDLHDINHGEYRDKANLALVNGEIDLLWTASWMETIGCDDLVKQSASYDLTDMLPNYDIYTAIPDWTWGSSAYNGKNYFIPCYKESCEGYNVMFRKELVDKYGWDLSTVKELKDIEPMLEDCKAEGLKYPYLSQHHAMFYRFYLDKFDFFSQDSFMAVDKDQDAVVNTLPTPEYAEFCSLMGDWAVKGYLSEDDLTRTTTETTTQTQDWGISWWTDVPNNEEADARYNQEVEMVRLTENWLQSNGTLGSCYTVSSTCTKEEAEACLKFLSLLYTDTFLADLYTFGIEGVDYNKVNGKVEKTDASLYNHSCWESTSVTILSLETTEPDNKVQLYSDFNNNAKDSIADGFRFDTSPVDAKYAACQLIFNEFGFALENGGFAPDDVAGAIDDYQKGLDAAGFQEVLEEAQKQYEEWKKVR